MENIPIKLLILKFLLALSMRALNCDESVRIKTGRSKEVTLSCSGKSDTYDDFYTLTKECTRLYFRCKEGEVSEVGFTNDTTVLVENKCYSSLVCNNQIDTAPNLVKIELSQIPYMETKLNCKDKIDHKSYNKGRCTKFIFSCVNNKLSSIKICPTGTVLYEDSSNGLSCQKISNCHVYDYPIYNDTDLVTGPYTTSTSQYTKSSTTTIYPKPTTQSQTTTTTYSTTTKTTTTTHVKEKF